MKTLKGMKKGFSSLENKKLENLKSIQGGIAVDALSTRMAKSNVYDSVGGGDSDYYSDSTSGEWKYEGRLSWH
jgi:putative peptide modification target (TIGR04139 family)